MASAYAAPREAAYAAESGAFVGGPVVAAAPARISWSAVLAGIVMALAIEVLLGVLGAAIGFATAQPGDPAAPDAASLATGAGLWSLGATLLALLIGGWAAARLAGVASRKDGMLHGLMIWGLALLLTLYLMTAAVGGALSMLGGLASSAGSGLRAMMPQMSGLNGDMIGQQAKNLLQPNAGQPADPAAMSAEDAQKEVARLLPDMAAGGDRAAQARNRVADIMAAQLHISRDDAARRIDEARTRATQAAQSAASAGADVAARGSLVAFGALLAGALAAGIGGALARPRLGGHANRFA